MTKEKAIQILNQRECCRECVVDNGDCNDCETKLMYSAEEVNQILFDITLEKAKLEEKLKKVESCEDCISRKAVLDLVNGDWKYEGLEEPIHSLPPVTPTQSWIPIVTREPTEEEKEYYFEQNGEELCYMIDSPMPNNGQEVLVSVGSLVSEDVFDEDFWDFENCDIENVDAWMPLPKPYEEKRGNENEVN